MHSSTNDAGTSVGVGDRETEKEQFCRIPMNYRIHGKCWIRRLVCRSHFNLSNKMQSTSQIANPSDLPPEKCETKRLPTAPTCSCHSMEIHPKSEIGRIDFYCERHRMRVISKWTLGILYASERCLEKDKMSLFVPSFSMNSKPKISEILFVFNHL